MPSYIGGGTITTSTTGASTGGTLTLIAPGAGKANAISAIMVRAAGTVSTAEITVATTAGSLTIALFGGPGTIPNGGVWTFPLPIVGLVNDATVITATLTGATAASVAIAALYRNVNA